MLLLENKGCYCEQTWQAYNVCTYCMAIWEPKEGYRKNRKIEDAK